MSARLDAIKPRLAAATPGPWVHECDDHHADVVHNHTSGVASLVSESRTENANLIAHAPDDIEFLLDEVDRLRQVATDIASHYAADIDGERGCCHTSDDLENSGRAPEFDGDTFDPLPDECAGRRMLDWCLQLVDRDVSCYRCGCPVPRHHFIGCDQVCGGAA